MPAHSQRVIPSELRPIAMLVPLALAGCLGGQTGQGFSDREPIRCPRTPVTVAADEPALLGSSSRALADSVRGPWREPLVWHRADRRTMITVDVAFTATQARLLQASPDAGAPACGDELELDVDVHLVTDDGALEESRPGTLRFTSTFSAVAWSAIDLATLGGSYDPGSEFDLSTWNNPELNARVWFSSGAMHGQLTLDGDDPNPRDEEFPVSGAIASWPAP
jgi:hypothetical protein